MIGRKFGADIENLVKEKSSNHIVLKSRSFSFDGKSKAPGHITRKISGAEERLTLGVNKTIADSALIIDKPASLLAGIQNDDQLVPKFLKECIAHMRNKQINNKSYMQLIRLKNPEYVSKRGELVNWMVNVHLNLKLFAQTLFIAVGYMDHYCSAAQISSDQVYLLAATCLFISGKYQQTYRIPTIRSIQQLSNKNLQKQQFIRMQSKVMDVLGFSLIVDTPVKYLQLYAKMIDLSDKNFYIAQYILQLSLVDHNFLQFSSSMLGSSAVYLVNKIRKIAPSWPQDFKQISGYEEGQLKGCAKNLCILLEKSQQIENAKNISNKFAKQQFCLASRIKLQRRNQ